MVACFTFSYFKNKLLYLQDLSNGPEGDNFWNISLQLPGNALSSKGVKDYHIQELSRESSFHSSIEAIWEVCKEIVMASLKKKILPDLETGRAN